MRFWEKIVKASRKTENRIKALKMCKFATLLLIEVFTVLFIGNFFNAKFLRHEGLKITSFESVTTVAYLLLALLTLAMSCAVLIFDVRKQSVKPWAFWANTIAILALASTAWYLNIETFLPTGKATLKSVKASLEFSEISLVGGIVVMAMSFIASLVINRRFFKKSNWYVFLSTLPFLCTSSILYRKYLSAENLCGSKHMSIKRIAEYMEQSQRLVGTTRADISYLNAYVGTFAIISLFSLTVLILIGEGVLYCGLFEKHFVEKERQKGKAEEKEERKEE